MAWTKVDDCSRYWDDDLWSFTDLIFVNSKSLNARALHLYMQKFDFSRLRLDSAFRYVPDAVYLHNICFLTYTIHSIRKLCSKLFLRAEAQVIDRVLEVFARRYWSCNSESLFGSSGTI